MVLIYIYVIVSVYLLAPVCVFCVFVVCVCERYQISTSKQPRHALDHSKLKPCCIKARYQRYLGTRVPKLRGGGGGGGPVGQKVKKVGREYRELLIK